MNRLDPVIGTWLRWERSWSNLKCSASHGTLPECHCYVFRIWPTAENQHLFAFVKTFCKHSTQTHMNKTEKIMEKKIPPFLKKHTKTHTYLYISPFLIAHFFFFLDLSVVDFLEFIGVQGKS